MILKYIILAYLVLQAIATIAMIDEPRQPMSKGGAILALTIVALIAIWVYQH